MRYYSPVKKCKLDSPWIGPYLIVSFMGWTIGIQKEPESPVGALPRRQENSPTTRSGVLVNIKGIDAQTCGYGTGGQYNA